jgi:uncharacterized membrane-anchored protein
MSLGVPTRILGILLAAATLCWPVMAPADTGSEDRQQALKAAGDAARQALVRGPASIALRDQATLALPEHFGFVPKKEAAALMNALGNRTDDDFIGLVFPAGENAQWFVSIEYNSSGYIKDDDAKHWDADKLLQSLKDGTEAANEDRAKVGIPPLEVTRWIEVPTYDAGTHRLIWSAEAKLKNGPDSDPTVNYNTYLLGREGYMSLNLITSASSVAQDKSAARQLLAAVSFKDGKRYGDFNSSTDKVAAYGLAALVAGVAAKKLGLLALLAATAVKFAKVIAVAVAAAGAAIAKWFRGRASQS